MIYYTGIGSRNTPPEVCSIFAKLAYSLAEQGFVLRSGGADGADKAFESGAVKYHDENINGYTPDIFLPWKGFNGSTSELYKIQDEAYKIAQSIHPNWAALSSGAKCLHARNVHQVLGTYLGLPSLFVICWTPKGESVGGTRTAIELAKSRNIPVFNFGLFYN